MMVNGPDDYYPPTRVGLVMALRDMVPFAKHIRIDEPDLRADPMSAHVTVNIMLAWWTFGLANRIARRAVEAVFREVIPDNVVGIVGYVGIWRLPG